MSQHLEELFEKDPTDIAKTWLKEAFAQEPSFGGAFALATVNSQGDPSVRFLLCKEITDQGLVFYTNYQSRKARDLAENPHAAAAFNWPTLQRQMRATGIVEVISKEDSKRYFHSRPRASQISAWASPQSKEIASRNVLEELAAKISTRFQASKEIPLPPFWGGYRLIFSTLQFWQGHPNRLHDRVFFKKDLNGRWTSSRLAP